MLSFSQFSPQPTTYIIEIEEPESTVELQNNCFVVNDVIGRGTVNVQRPNQILVANNNFGTYDAGIQCQFLHVDLTNECIEYDVDSCGLDFAFETEAPTSTPATIVATSAVPGHSSFRVLLTIPVMLSCLLAVYMLA